MPSHTCGRNVPHRPSASRINPSSPATIASAGPEEERRKARGAGSGETASAPGARPARDHAVATGSASIVASARYGFAAGSGIRSSTRASRLQSRSRPASRGPTSCSASRSTRSTVPTAAGRPFAGAGSPCQAWESCSSRVTVWILRVAFTSARVSVSRGRRVLRRRAGGQRVSPPSSQSRGAATSRGTLSVKVMAPMQRPSRATGTLSWIAYWSVLARSRARR